MPSKLVTIQPQPFENLLASLLIVDRVPGADDWRGTALLVRAELLDEIDVAISTLQGYRKMLNTNSTSGKYTHRVAHDAKYADQLQTNFINAAKLFAGKSLSDELITEYMRPQLREFFGLED